MELGDSMQYAVTFLGPRLTCGGLGRNQVITWGGAGRDLRLVLVHFGQFFELARYSSSAHFRLLKILSSCSDEMECLVNRNGAT